MSGPREPTLEGLVAYVRKGVKDPTKRRALVAALQHPDLVRARKVGNHGLLVEGPGGIHSTHLSGVESKRAALTLKALRQIGLA